MTVTTRQQRDLLENKQERLALPSQLVTPRDVVFVHDSAFGPRATRRDGDI